MTLKLFFLLAFLCVHSCFGRPNIVFFVVDDVGWNDLSFHGSEQIMTPNIDLLALHGIVLENYYTDAQGTPSRSAMFTGKYPMRMGTQGESIGAAEDRGIPVNEKLLPSYLQDLGYATHLVGKWGLGKSREYLLPNNRGFDTFYGFLGSSVDYFTYNHVATCNKSELYGLDLFSNYDPVLNQSGHISEVLTSQAIDIIREHDSSTPLYLHVAHAAAHTGGGLVNLQAFSSAENSHIAHNARRYYADMITGLDKSLGQIVSALAEAGMLNNTMIIFTSDNGAPSTGLNKNFGSNLPLRGTKGTPWEGAVRSTAFIWDNDVKSETWKGIFHVTDWMPTIISAAGGTVSHPIDGIDQWDAMIFDQTPPRNNAVIAVDDLKGWGALRYGDFKFVVGNVQQSVSGYYGKGLMKIKSEIPLYEKVLHDSETAIVFREVLDTYLNMSEIYKKIDYYDLPKMNESNDIEICLPNKEKGCLYNITADPLESDDLWLDEPEVVKKLSIHFRLLWSKIVPRRQLACDVRADPSLNNDYIWYPWLDVEEPVPEPLIIRPHYPLQVSDEQFQYYIDFNLKTLKEKLTTYVRNITDSFVNNISDLF